MNILLTIDGIPYPVGAKVRRESDGEVGVITDYDLRGHGDARPLKCAFGEGQSCSFYGTIDGPSSYRISLVDPPAARPGPVWGELADLENEHNLDPHITTDRDEVLYTPEA